MLWTFFNASIGRSAHINPKGGRRTMRRLLASRGITAAATGVIMLALAGGGYAIAASGGTIKACANKRSGALRLANKCKKSERGLSWNAIGPAGERGPRGLQGAQGTKGDIGQPGTNGQSVTSSPVLSGNASCPNGGSQFTSASGVTYACNGTPATKLWAVVNSNGTIRSQSGGVVPVSPNPGSCTNTITNSICVLGFGTNITSCAVIVSPETNTSPPTSAPLVSAFAGQHPYNGDNHDVVVQTYAGTTPTPEAFDIAVLC